MASVRVVATAATRGPIRGTVVSLDRNPFNGDNEPLAVDIDGYIGAIGTKPLADDPNVLMIHNCIDDAMENLSQCIKINHLTFTSLIWAALGDERREVAYGVPGVEKRTFWLHPSSTAKPR
jgi:hypothetical protein